MGTESSFANCIVVYKYIILRPTVICRHTVKAISVLDIFFLVISDFKITEKIGEAN